jgi:hypothetical protein
VQEAEEAIHRGKLAAALLYTKEEHMATARQILANRRNAALSRGPQTTVGKARSKLNALRHGLAAQLTSTRSAEVEALAQALCAQFRNASPADARELAQAQIDILRVRQVRVDILERSTSPIFAGEFAPHGTITRTVSALNRLDRYERRALSRRNNIIRLLA